MAIERTELVSSVTKSIILFCCLETLAFASDEANSEIWESRPHPYVAGALAFGGVAARAGYFYSFAAFELEVNHYTRFETPLTQTWAYTRNAKLNFFLSGAKIGIGFGVRDLKARATEGTSESITADHSAFVQSWEIGYHFDLPLQRNRMFLTAEIDSYQPRKTRRMTTSSKSMNLTQAEEQNIERQLMASSFLLTAGLGIYLW